MRRKASLEDGENVSIISMWRENKEVLEDVAGGNTDFVDVVGSQSCLGILGQKVWMSQRTWKVRGY